MESTAKTLVWVVLVLLTVVMFPVCALGLWTGDGNPLCTAAGDQSYPTIVSDGAGGVIVTWQDSRSGNSDVYAQRVNASGTVQWAAEGVALCTATGGQSSPRIVSDGAGGAIVTWGDSRDGFYARRVYAQGVNASGAVQWAAEGVAVCTATGIQWGPTIVSDGAGGAIVTWYDFRAGNDVRIYAQRVNASGAVQWTADGVALSTTTGGEFEPTIVSDGAGGAIVTWQDFRSLSDWDIYAQRVNAFGAVQWTANGVALCRATGMQYRPTIVSDGTGGAIVTWYDYGNESNYGIYAQSVNAWGAVQWAADGVALCTAMGDQRTPRIVSDGAGGAVVTWCDYRSGSNCDIYAQRVDRNGYWGYPSANIRAVRDVPGDQGGFVNVAWDASRLDPWPAELISKYTVWRAISAQRVAELVEQGGCLLTSVSDALPLTGGSVLRVQAVQGSTYYWELMSEVKAYYLDGYSKVVPTLFDSTSVCKENHYFQVIAHAADPSQFWVSDPDSGYSADNLSPAPPSGLAGDYNYPPSELHISWGRNVEHDLSHYAVYKGDTEDFVPGESNRIGAPKDTSFVDTSFDPTRSYYKVSAWDIHENESGYALLRPQDITGVSNAPAVPAVSLLEQNVPNPFNPMTVIRFAVARTGRVKLAVYNVMGRPVRVLAEGVRQASMYEVRWDGRDDTGSAVASGVYLYKLEAPGYGETKKMVLLR